MSVLAISSTAQYASSDDLYLSSTVTMDGFGPVFGVVFLSLVECYGGGVNKPQFLSSTTQNQDGSTSTQNYDSTWGYIYLDQLTSVDWQIAVSNGACIGRCDIFQWG